MEEREESDQLPEEQPGSAVTDDSAGKRSGANENAGGDDKDDEDAGDATGNPANAGGG